MSGPAVSIPVPRRFGLVNWRGVYTLYRRETVRFFRYAGETLAGPAISSLMFLAIFQLALGGEDVRPGVGLPAFIDALGIPPDPNMVNHPRTSSYVRTDDFTEEADKYFARKGANTDGSAKEAAE